MPDDEYFMRRALYLAARARGQTSPNPMVGAVLVKNGIIIAEGYHHHAGEDHAERIVLKKAGRSAQNAALYINIEPCCHWGRTPPCTDIILESGVRRVVAAIRDPFPSVCGRGLHILRDAGIEVTEGMLKGEARRLNEVFFTFHEKNRPFVMLKWAMSLDGRTSTDSGQSKWISSEVSRRMAHRMRSWYDCIAVGAGTVLMDNPQLTVRLSGYKRRQPACIILDTTFRTPPDAALFKAERRVIIAGGAVRDAAIRKRSLSLEAQGAEIIHLPIRGGLVDIPSLMQKLYKMGFQSLFVEGGRHVAGSFFKAEMVDKLGVFLSSRIIGGLKSASPLLFKGPLSIKDCPNFTIDKIKRSGTDFYLEAYPV